MNALTENPDAATDALDSPGVYTWGVISMIWLALIGAAILHDNPHAAVWAKAVLAFLFFVVPGTAAVAFARWAAISARRTR